MRILIRVVACAAIIVTVTTDYSSGAHSNVPYDALAKSVLPYDTLLKNGVPQHIHFHCNAMQTQNGISNAVDTVVSQQTLQRVQQEQSTFLQGLQGHLENGRIGLFGFLRDYKYYLIGGLAASLYGYVCYTVYHGNQFAQKKELWSAWKSSVDLDTLLSIPQKDLAQDLLVEIQRRYTNPRNPTDFVSPLADFLTALEKERTAIEFYATFNLWVNRIYLSKVVPLGTSTYKNAEKRLQRITYLKNTFLTWAADFKLDQSGATIRK